MKAFITGTIVKFERNYSITLEALNGQTGDQVALVQASVLQNNAAQARQSYEEFFKLWSNADADLPVLIGAKKEYEKLK